MALTKDKEDQSPGAQAVQDQLDQAEDNVEGRKTQAKLDEEFRDQQKLAAAVQNQTGENAVPEQRPQANQESLPYHQSPLYNALKESGDLPDDKPMDREAYERASSEDQAKKAAKESKIPRLFEGQHVKVLKEPYKDLGAVGAIISVLFDDDDEAAKSRSGVADLNTYAQPSEYVVRLRGVRDERLSLKPEEVRPIGVTEYNASEA